MNNRHSEDALEAALRRDASRLPLTPVPPGLDRRIAVLIDQADETPVRSSWLAGRTVWAPLLAAAALVVAALGSKWLVGSSHLPAPEPGADPAESAQLVQTVKALPAAFWSRLQPGAARVLRDDPLRQEASDLYTDARSAAGFLAVNFLPTAGLAPAGSRSRG